MNDDARSEILRKKVVETVKDQNLKLCLAFGIGMHHAGLSERDRNTVEELFVNQKIQVLVSTATLAWGVNFPTHLVIIKGTEYYDGKQRRYVDFPVTDVLQMMGRAGRPQWDDHGVAVVYVTDTKKPFYKKFLYEPFPVESSLLNVLADHLNAEIVAGTVNTKQQAMDYLTWTYLFRRLVRNPTYYGMQEGSAQELNVFLSNVINKALNELQQSACVEIAEDNRTIISGTLGQIASFYYLQHKTVKIFKENITHASTLIDLLKILTDVAEYDEVPVRHNEDEVNESLAKHCPVRLDANSYDSSHTKAHILYQAHFCRLTLPSTDYLTDMKSVLDQAIRILQAMLDVSAEAGWLRTSLYVVQLMQMSVQGRWATDPPACCLPFVEPHMARCFRPADSLPEIQKRYSSGTGLLSLLTGQLDPIQINEIQRVLRELPVLNVAISLRGWFPNEQTESSKPVLSASTTGPTVQRLNVHGDQEYVLVVSLQRLNLKRESRAFAPKFPKAKDEGWILIVGCVETGELIALKRIGVVKRKTSVSLVFATPCHQQSCVYCVMVLSDSYLGLDQEHQLHLDVHQADIQAQVNAEVKLTL